MLRSPHSFLLGHLQPTAHALAVPSHHRKGLASPLAPVPLWLTSSAFAVWTLQDLLPSHHCTSPFPRPHPLSTQYLLFMAHCLFTRYGKGSNHRSDKSLHASTSTFSLHARLIEPSCPLPACAHRPPARRAWLVTADRRLALPVPWAAGCGRAGRAWSSGAGERSGSQGTRAPRAPVTCTVTRTVTRTVTSSKRSAEPFVVG